eukprot:5114107-Pyramimonas_sp.AAC.1
MARVGSRHAGQGECSTPPEHTDTMCASVEAVYCGRCLTIPLGSRYAIMCQCCRIASDVRLPLGAVLMSAWIP